MIHTAFNTGLQKKLRKRLWRDDLAKMPCHLYPHRSKTELHKIWRRDYEALPLAPTPLPSQVAALFAPAAPADLRPRYLADPGGRWYALTTLRFNRRTRHRFCYARYWWAADRAALQALVQAVLTAWQGVPFDWLKLRLGYSSGLGPDDFHPQAIRQSYVVAGRPEREAVRHRTVRLNLGSLRVEQPLRVEPAWWTHYRILLEEQQHRQTPDTVEAWDYSARPADLRQEMEHLLNHGGRVINLFEGRHMVGHISYSPDSYREQLIQRCWHIHNIIVKTSHRRQGLGQALHYLAADFDESAHDAHCRRTDSQQQRQQFEDSGQNGPPNCGWLRDCAKSLSLLAKIWVQEYTMPEEIKAIIFDVGGVLIRTHNRDGRQRWASRLGMEAQDYENFVFGGESGRQAQLGRKTYEAHWQWLQNHFGLTRAEADEMFQDFFAGDVLNELLVGHIKRLRQAGYCIGLLSNAADNLRRLLTEVYPLLDYVDGVVISAEVGLMKPEPKIYYLAAESVGVKPEEVLFVDDFSENIAGAKKVGMKTLHFTDPASAQEQLTAITGVE